MEDLEFVGCQGHLSSGGKNYGSLICCIFLEHMIVIDSAKSLTYVLVFDGAENVKLSGEILKIYYPELTLMRRFKHTVYIFFNDVSNIPIVNQIIIAQKAIYNIFGSGIYCKPRSISKSKPYEFHNSNIDLFSGNDTILAGYFI